MASRATTWTATLRPNPLTHMAAALAALLAEISMPTYKIISPEAAQACREYSKAYDLIKEAGFEFAKRFPGSTPLISSGVSGASFFGVSFSPANESALWTRPQRDAGNAQRPRSVPPKGIKGDERRAMVAELKLLNEEWSAHAPKLKADRNPVFEVIGTDWGSALLCGIQYFELGDVVYLKTTIDRKESWQEILNSEYEQADAAHRAARKAVAA